MTSEPGQETVPEYVEIDGHSVPADQADLFFHANDGRRLSNDEWDEAKRVRDGNHDDLIPAEFRGELS